jgi:tetratricopeptide (TPR) repeat protein
MQNYQKLNRSIAMLLVMLSIGCSTSALAEQSKQFSLLGNVKGNVQIVPKGGKPSKGFIGDTVDYFSTLIFGENASVTCVCPDGSTRSVRGRRLTIENICKDTKRKIFDEERTVPTRGADTLSDTERLEIEADVKFLQQQPIDNDAKGIAIAYLYQSKGLDAKAIEELERLLDGGSNTTAVYQLLGDIYHDRKISDELAIDRYQTGLKLAKKEGNVRAQKYIQAQLKVLRKIAN